MSYHFRYTPSLIYSVVAIFFAFFATCNADEIFPVDNFRHIYFDGIQVDADVPLKNLHDKYGYVDLYRKGDAGQEDLVCYIAGDGSVVLFELFWDERIQGVTVADRLEDLDSDKCGHPKEKTFIDKSVNGIRIGALKNELISILGKPYDESRDEIYYRAEYERKLTSNEQNRLNEAGFEYGDDTEVGVVISINLWFRNDHLSKYSISRYSTL